MEAIYSDKDREILDKANKTLDDYEKHLCAILLEKSITTEEARRVFLEDKHRQKLIDSIISIKQTMTPAMVIKQCAKARE